MDVMLFSHPNKRFDLRRSGGVPQLEKIKNSGDPSDRVSKRERDEPQPCKKCSELEERLSGEATKANRLMRRIRDHQQEVRSLSSLFMLVNTRRGSDFVRSFSGLLGLVALLERVHTNRNLCLLLVCCGPA